MGFSVNEAMSCRQLWSILTDAIRYKFPPARTGKGAFSDTEHGMCPTCLTGAARGSGHCESCYNSCITVHGFHLHHCPYWIKFYWVWSASTIGVRGGSCDLYSTVQRISPIPYIHCLLIMTLNRRFPCLELSCREVYVAAVPCTCTWSHMTLSALAIWPDDDCYIAAMLPAPKPAHSPTHFWVYTIHCLL